MSTAKIVAIILTIGALFNTAGHVLAADIDCTAKQPHVSAGPVCLDVPHGPRFWGRR